MSFDFVSGNSLSGITTIRRSYWILNASFEHSVHYEELYSSFLVFSKLQREVRERGREEGGRDEGRSIRTNLLLFSQPEDAYEMTRLIPVQILHCDDVRCVLCESQMELTVLLHHLFTDELSSASHNCINARLWDSCPVKFTEPFELI